MRANSSGAKGTGLLLALALLSNACVSLTPPPGRGRSLRYTPQGATGPAVAGGVGEESPLVLDSQPPFSPGPEAPERLHRRRGSRDAVTGAGPGGVDATVWQSALAAHLAFRKGVGEVSGSTRRISGELSRLKASYSGIAGAGNGIFVRYVDYGEAQSRWIDAELAAATELAAEASEVKDPDMQLALLRLAGPRLEAAMMRQLVRAGVLSLPAVSAAVRIQAGQVMMAQGRGDLPRGVRDALGDSPEVRSMRVTGKTGAGMAERPRHHVMPKEFRAWFEKRGFTGKMSIERFCVTLQQAHHQAIHGGGNWKLGRAWPGEWNRMIMEALYDAETKAGRMLTRNTILEIVAKQMKEYRIAMNFIRCGGK